MLRKTVYCRIYVHAFSSIESIAQKSFTITKPNCGCLLANNKMKLIEAIISGVFSDGFSFRN